MAKPWNRMTLNNITKVDSSILHEVVDLIRSKEHLTEKQVRELDMQLDVDRWIDRLGEDLDKMWYLLETVFLKIVERPIEDFEREAETAAKRKPLDLDAFYRKYRGKESKGMDFDPFVGESVWDETPNGLVKALTLWYKLDHLQREWTDDFEIVALSR